MKKKFMASLLSMLLVFSAIPTITYATEMEVETVAAEAETEEETAAVVAETEAQTAAVETETEEQTAADEAGTDGKADISTGEITESLENTESEASEETEEDPVEESTDESDSEENAVTSMEEQTTSQLLGSVLSVAETEAETQTATETETLCDHGNDAESCAVCDLEEQIASLPDLDEIQTMTGDEEEALYTQASALADVYYDDLTEDEQAQVSNIDTLWDVLDYFSSGLTLTALTAVSADTSWYNDTDTSFTITTAEQLAGLASLVNAGNDFSGKTITLGNSIDLNSEAWTPIGASSSYPFSGTFDGNGYTVSGLYIINSTGNCQGLFGVVKSGTVQNVTVNGSVTGTRYVGGIVGLTLLGATIKNCTNSATVSSGVNIGGVVGYNEESTVTNCINSGSVTSNETNGYVGGVVGTNISIVTNCINSGEVSGYGCVGGVVGYNIAALSYSYNSGTVSCTTQTAGGVVGYNNSNDVYKGSVSNCYYLSTTASAAYRTNRGTLTSVESKTTTEFASGEVAYLLNGSVSGGTTWYQNIDNGKTVDSYPVLDSTHGTVYYGKNCNQVTVYSNTNLSATNGHVYETVVTDPTCTAGGYTTYTCSVCGETKTEKIEATGHSYEAIVTEPTCTEKGYTTYTCSVCGDSYTADETDATGHSYEAVVTDPTCTAGSYTTYTCSACGDSYTANETEATGHTWDNGIVTTEATCTEDGVKTYTCTVCDETKTEKIEATGHSYEAVVTDPTCTTAGYTTYTCSVCGYSYTADETDATGHSYEAVVTDPTCTAGGYTTYTCSACGDSYTADETEATGHSWNEGTVTKAATCTEDGVMTYTCSVCGETKIEKIETTGHNYEAVVTDPTCTEKGYTTHTCSVCGDSYTDNETEATGHNYESVVTEPSCTKGGYTTYTCVYCGDSYTADETKATGHSWDEGVVTTEATCTEDGVKTYTCTVCGETKTETIAATGHSYKAVVTEPTCTTGGYTTYTCSICGDSYTADETEATGHSWDEGVVTTEATCTEDGEKTYTCTVCGETRTEKIDATGHSYEAVVTEPTCTEKGYTTYTCSVCGDSYKADETDATGHTSGEAVKENEVAATCTTDGSYDSVVYCTVCGGELSRDTVILPATGHSFGEWETITSPTCEDSGSEQRTCSVCQYAENRSLDAAGHDWEEVYTVDQEAACTTDGSRSIHCKNCEAVKDSEVIPATGHTWDEGIVTAEAACEETGLMLYTCTVCQETKTEIIPASGHILTHVVSNAATCTGEGNIEYWYCEDCGKYFSDEMAGTEISLADTVIPATGHSYGEWETVISPTCEDTGSEKRSCTVCGYTETRDVEPAGHDWEEDYTVDVEAGCTTDGSKSIHCRNCAAVKDSEVIPATGHSYEAVITEPTYTEQGYTVYTCTNCGDSYITDYTAIKVIDGTDENLSTKTLVQELTAVPEGLKSLYSSVDELILELISRVTVGTGYTADNALVYDVVLQYRINGGEWINATVDNFPATGITVTLPYPEGTDSSYEFTVLHMFTETSSRLGITAGGTETPTITKSDDGLVVTLTGLSPVAVSWKEAEEETEETETEASTESAETESAAAESETTATESESESETNASPQTGDNTPFETWFAVLILSALAISVLFFRRYKAE